ncbi:MAG: hypothetical protein KTR31_14490 [Myxococcales bacterium]|nr:hypothetical protein [Myxococcales bacterium]
MASAYTTVLGARQILPSPLSDILGVSVQAMLFLLLAGFAVQGAPFRRWVVVAIFGAASIYTSFFTYYEQLAAEADLKAQLDKAMQTHAVFTAAVYQPASSRIEKLDSEAEALFGLAERESKRGSTSGVTGYGPVAKRYAKQGSDMKVEAERLLTDVKRLQPHFEYEMEGLTPEDVYRKDLKAWQLAPADWKGEVPMPNRDDYVDLAAQVALITPFNRVKNGELPALTALALASLVDGIAIFLGTAIQARQRPTMDSWSKGMADVISQARRSRDRVKAAIDGTPQPDDAYDEMVLGDALQVMHLRIAGRGSDFLTTFYQAIHPETGALDYSGLQRHPNATYRIAARMLVDQFRMVSWVEVDDGWWSVPDESYARVTAWLGEQIRRECEVEARAVAETDEVQEPERTLRLVLPA